MTRWIPVMALALAAPATAAKPQAPAGWAASWQAANAPYKGALYATNQGDASVARQQLPRLQAAWSQFRAAYGQNPPAPFHGDDAWTSDLADIAGWISTARAEVAAGKVHEAHDTLEQVRIRWMEMRTRAGVPTFGDHLTRFHEPMETVVTTVKDKTAGTLSDEDVARLRETMPDLRAVWEQVRGYKAGALPPSRLSARRAMTERVWRVITEMEDALRSGDRAALLKAGQALRPAYAPLYMQFG